MRLKLRKRSFRHLLSSFVGLVEHVVEHHRLSRLVCLNRQALHQMLFCEPLLAPVREPLNNLRSHALRHCVFGREIVVYLN